MEIKVDAEEYGVLVWQLSEELKNALLEQSPEQQAGLTRIFQSAIKNAVGAIAMGMMATMMEQDEEEFMAVYESLNMLSKSTAERIARKLFNKPN